MVDYKQDTKPRHPIGVASTRTGIAQDVLRAWERRYGAVVPRRTPTGRRLYTDRDLLRLALLRRLVEAGRRISDIAGASTDELKALAEEDRAAGGVPSLGADRRDGAEIEPGSFLDAAIAAVSKLSRENFERVLSDAAVSMSPPEIRKQLIVPLLREIGHRWQTGSARIVHEHLASTIVRKFIEGTLERSYRDSRPRLILTTPSGQRHELGAIMAAAAAEEAGWDAIYLGADLPAEEIAAAARELGARAVALSIVYKGDDRVLVEEVRRIKRALEPGVGLIVGGRAAASLRSLFEGMGVPVLDDFGEFQAGLESLFGRGKTRHRRA